MIYSTGPVIITIDQGEYIALAQIYTPPALRGKGLMRTLLTEEFLPAVKKDIYLAFDPDTEDGTDPSRLRAFYESLGFEFHADGGSAVLVHDRDKWRSKFDKRTP